MSSTGFRGVKADRKAKTGTAWQAALQCAGVDHYLGRFSSPEAAAKAYDRALCKLSGVGSGPNCGPLTVAEKAEVDGWTMDQVCHQPGRMQPAWQIQRALKPVDGTSSKYRGVHWFKRQFASGIKVKGVTKHLGNFDDEADAARAYDKAARKLHGSEAVLNFPDAGGDDDEPAHTDASDGSDEESDAASDGPPARVAHTTKLGRPAHTAASIGALRAARKVHGAKAILNFPDDGSPAHAAPPAMRAGAPPLPPTRHVSGIAAAATAKVASLPSRPEKALGGPIKRRAADGATLYDGIKRQRAEEHGAAQAPPAVLMPPLPGLRRIHVATMGGAAPQTLQPSAAVPQQPRFTLTVADLAAPLMWLFRAPATGEVMGPFLISALSRSFQDGDITARDARLLRVWRQGDPEAACMSLEQALELPMIRARSLQLEMLRARHAAPS